MIVGPNPNPVRADSTTSIRTSIKTGTFVLTGSTLTSGTTILSAIFNFGTGAGEHTGTGTVCTSPTQPNCGGTPTSGPLPEPNSTALALLGLAVLSGTLLLRKKQSGRA